MIQTLHRRRTQVLLGIILVMFIVLLFAPGATKSGTMSRLKTVVVAASRPSLSARHQVPEQASIEACFAYQQSNSRADCFFRVATVVLQNPQDQGDWTGMPAAGFDSLGCAPPAEKNSQSFFTSFVVLTELRSAERLSTGVSAPQKRPTVGKAGGSASGVNPLSTSGVFFNKTASDFLCNLRKAGATKPVSAGLTSKASPLGQQAAPGKQPVSFPEGSVFVKPLWYLVPNVDGRKQIPVWAGKDRSFPPDSQTGISLTRWKSFVSIDDLPPDKPCDFQFKNWNGGKPPIPLACFFSKTFSNPSDCAEMTKNSGGGIIQPNFVDPGSNGCYLVLMALNISARIGGKWTFQTYWWSAMSKDDPNPHVTPPDSSASWPFFVMGTARSNLFNPYLEGNFVGGANTNCATCHAKAAFYSVTPPNDALLVCLFQNSSNAPKPHKPDASNPQILCPPSGPNLQSVKTDSVWSLADTNVALTSRLNSSR